MKSIENLDESEESLDGSTENLGMTLVAPLSPRLLLSWHICPLAFANVDVST